MPRELGDVLHYLIPEASRDVPDAPRAEPGLRSAPRPGPERPAALPIVALPIDPGDAIRSAFAWNLAVELARLGANATLLRPRRFGGDEGELAEGKGPIGARLVLSDAEDLGALNGAALDVAVERAAEAQDGGLVLVLVPPEWLATGVRARALLRWVLLFSTTERDELQRTYATAKRVLEVAEAPRVGVTFHAARRISDAESAWARLAGTAARHAGTPLLSYGLLVDDLHVYRSIVGGRPIGLEHPQSRAARALRDVAALLLDDARSQTGA